MASIGLLEAPKCYDASMKPIDLEQERKRLAGAYSQMADEQLEELAADPDRLTDLARSVLKNEMGRRGLHVDMEPIPAAAEEIPASNIVTIRTFKSLNEASLATGLLQSCGIDCFTADDNMARLETVFAFGIRLQVKEEDAEAAEEILDHPLPDDTGDEN